MRILVRILLFSAIANIALAQKPSLVSSESTTKIRIHRVTINASNLPAGDRDRIVHHFAQNAYFEGELQSRIQTAFQNLGYFKAHVDEPKIFLLEQSQATNDADISVTVEEGPQYRLGEIHFQKADLFPTDQLRRIFPIQSGDLFNKTTFSKGLDNLRHLYATEGYINCVAIPVVKMDESHRTIDLVIEMNEGEPYDFGRLFLDGKEPHAGAGQALMESWKTLQGKRFNPDLLMTWLVKSASLWPGAAAAHWDVIQLPPSGAVDIRLLLP